MFLLLACTPDPWQPVDLAEHANVFIGTGGLGFGYGGLSPAASAPDGLVKVGPDTSVDGARPSFNHSAGYNFPDTHLEGFSHYRLPGIGVSDGGAVRVVMSDSSSFDANDLRAPLSHEDEEAWPGFYRVEIPEGLVELTATPRAAHHRYQWHDEERWLIVDLSAGSASDISEHVASIEADAAGFSGEIEFRGNVTSNEDDHLPLFTVGRFSVPAAEVVAEGDKAAFRFDADVELQVGLSAVDLDGARNNLEVELPSWDFAATVEQAWRSWDEALGNVRIAGGTEEEQVLFSSALMHTRMMPTLFTDIDGRYRGLDLEVHEADGWTYYTDFSLWDTYRTLHPWVILAWPELAADHAHSLADMGAKRGFIPRWPAGVIESGSMVGHSADIVLGESMRKGVTDWPAEEAFEVAWTTATDPEAERSRGEYYLDHGWIPHDLEHGGVSKTQEYAIDDAGLAMWAAELGRADEARMLFSRSASYQNVFNPETGWMQGRNSDGSWVEMEMEGWPDPYVEGNPYQYAFLAPHDVEGLAELYGGPAELRARLSEIFELSADEEDTFAPDPYYWHGNEPDLHYAFLFAALGDPSQTQRWVKWILETRYSAGPGGLDGNDDGGTLSAWYCFATLGLYPLNGTDDYVLTTPRFEVAVIDRPGGALTIEAHGEGDYTAAVLLDGEPLQSAIISHGRLTGERHLLFLRSPEPTDWGSW
ncbi:MAG TPA: GH92 family glycosyl hydrolase [Myxococcota bacterium]|nr:GH92 family glycosyl hydrolase [Myxococcota bacterium]